MFILSQEKDKAYKALQKLRQTLLASSEVVCGGIDTRSIGDHWLHWFECKPSDNLHVFTNGVVIGKIDFSESRQDVPVVHEGAPVPDELHPLLNATMIKLDDSELLIAPNHITNIFVSPNGVADMQLVLADFEDFLPDPTRIAVLSAVGYFPGNLTLFEDIRKIPFLHAYSTKKDTFIQLQTIERRKNNDQAMIDRLISIVPQVPSYLGMSGGYDSRFVLGCLLQSGVRPHLMHMEGNETQVVKSLASELSLDLSIPHLAAPLGASIYTIMTDGLIYFRGGEYSRIRNSLDTPVFTWVSMRTLLLRMPSKLHGKFHQD